MEDGRWQSALYHLPFAIYHFLAATPFPVAASEPLAVSRLVLGLRSHTRLIAGVRGFELTLAFEVPALVAFAVFTAGRPALGQSAVVAGAIGRALIHLRIGGAEFRARQPSVPVGVA